MPHPLPAAVLDQQMMDMRWRILSLAADLDRIDRAGAASDARVPKLCEAIAALLLPSPDRAERVQMILSDSTPGPR